MTEKNRAWLTYAWKDNTGPDEGNVTFLMQELERAGADIRTDRRDLVAGRHVWDQIEEHITDPETNAWVFVVTAASLASKPCQEELQWALTRALDKRGEPFPMIGIIMGEIDPTVLPMALRSRLYVSTFEANWAARVVAGIRGQKEPLEEGKILPFTVHFCGTTMTSKAGIVRCDHVLEIRPRIGRWDGLQVGVTAAEAARLVAVRPGRHSGTEPPRCLLGHNDSGFIRNSKPHEEHGLVWTGLIQEVTPSASAHIWLKLDGAPIQLKVVLSSYSGPTRTIALRPIGAGTWNNK